MLLKMSADEPLGFLRTCIYYYFSLLCCWVRLFQSAPLNHFLTALRCECASVWHPQQTSNKYFKNTHNMNANGGSFRCSEKGDWMIGVGREKKQDKHWRTHFLRNDYANGRKALACFTYKLCLHTWKEALAEAFRSFTQLFLYHSCRAPPVPHKTVVRLLTHAGCYLHGFGF